MVFLYETQLKAIPDCPPNTFESLEREAFRFVFEEVSDPKNSLPPALKNPKRFLSKSDAKQCAAHALSFYSTERAAREKFSYFNKAGFLRSIGDRIAKWTLKDEDGISCEANHEGHFDLHPYTGFNLKAFQIIA